MDNPKCESFAARPCQLANKAACCPRDVNCRRRNPLVGSDRDHTVRDKPAAGFASPRVPANDRTPEGDIGGSLNTTLNVEQAAELSLVYIKKDKIAHPQAASRSARSMRPSTV